MARESEFEKHLIEQIMRAYPGAIILKNNANLIQGIPDRLVLWGPRWAAFDAKESEKAPKRPNQDYYIREMNDMSYASFVYPQNEEVFLNELQQALRSNRRTRISIG
jgi:hypothetical protein